MVRKSAKLEDKINIDFEESSSDPNISTKQMIMIPHKGFHIYPGISLSFEENRDAAKLAIKKLKKGEDLIFIGSQKEKSSQWPSPEEIYDVGCVVRIRQILDSQNGIKILAEGVSRAEIVKVVKSTSHYVVNVKYLPTIELDNDNETQAYKRSILSVLEEYGAVSGKYTPEMVTVMKNTKSLSLVCDMVASNLAISVTERQSLLEQLDAIERASRILEIIKNETEIGLIEKGIMEKVRFSLDRGQKDYFLREQLKVIQEELGDKFGISDEIEKFNEILKNLKIPKEGAAKLSKEITRLSYQPMGSPELSSIRSYLENVFDLPWGKKTTDNLDIANARKKLDKDHYGLEKVKERILEFLAVRKLKMDAGVLTSKGPILCLVGPPGVGKTSIAKSLASTLGRKYIRMSLGGVHDEAEIRGHRRTYIGAMPGRFIQAMKQAKSDNPLILLDEIDKLGKDYRGDPSSALLEVLDPEQNNTFRDHYIEIPYDLSNVMFITTANSWETIPAPLYDRMEIVNLTGYTQEEKVEIAIRHIIPKQIVEHALKKANIKFTREAVIDIIANYTRESGVRELERQVAKACRKGAMLISEKGLKKVNITRENLEEILGKKIYKHDLAFSEDQIGVATGLAWTPFGGDTLAIEVSLMPGSGKIELTGQLGDVMQESARIAISYVKSNCDKYNIDKEILATKDIHIHVPAGATPKDGPSAGITLTTALVSVFTGKAIRHNVAMTGEMTLRGRVLPIGGLKEKLIAAVRAGIDTVLIPSENKKDLDDLPLSVLGSLTIHEVTNVDEVIEKAIRL